MCVLHVGLLEISQSVPENIHEREEGVDFYCCDLSTLSLDKHREPLYPYLQLLIKLTTYTFIFVPHSHSSLYPQTHGHI